MPDTDTEAEPLMLPQVAAVVETAALITPPDWATVVVPVALFKAASVIVTL